MAKSLRWSQEEESLLTSLYPKYGGSQELLEYFPYRTLVSLTVKAAKLGLKVENNIRKGITEAEYLEILDNTNFILIGDYKNKTTLTPHECKLCGHVWEARPQALLKKGANCPICAEKNRKKPIEEVDSLLKERGYERLSEYFGSLSPLTLKHLVCGHIWSSTYSYIQQGSGCPICYCGFGYKIGVGKDIPEAYLYVLSIILDDTPFYKIGVSSRDIKYRISELKKDLNKLFANVDIDILKVKKDTGKNILLLESLLHTKYKEYSAKRKLPSFAGYTEMYFAHMPIDSLLKEV